MTETKRQEYREMIARMDLNELLDVAEGKTPHPDLLEDKELSTMMHAHLDALA